MASTIIVRVWDLPIRLFHWSLVILIGFSWATVSLGWMDLHYISGEAILALLLFRVVWGFVGSDTARFLTFLKSPAAALHHLSHLRRREPDTEIGHNPAGGWMVIGLLVLLFGQVATGLFSGDDDAAVDGPLRHLVSRHVSETLTEVHGVIFTLIQIAVVLHVVAVLAYLALKGHNLLRAMITGSKTMPAPVAQPRLVNPLWAAVIVGAAVVAVLALVRGS